MAWRFVPVLAGSSLERAPYSAPGTVVLGMSSEIEPRSMSYSPGCEAAPWTQRPYMLTFTHSTLQRGVDLWISYLRDSRASRSRPLAEAEKSLSISGPTSCASSSNAKHLSSSARMSSEPRLSAPVETSSEPVFVPDTPEFPPPSWVPRIAGCDGGYLPTLTTRRNQFADSMQKWPAYRRLRALAGRSVPIAFWEWMMGFPIGWTEVGCLATRQYLPPRRSRSID